MKKFIKNIALFVFPVLVILITMEPFLRKIPNEYSVKDNYLKKNSNTIDVLYLGSSHIYFGLNPEFSKYKAYNASYISQSINLDWLILNKYKENWKNLKFIVLPADYISMYSTLILQKMNGELKITIYITVLVLALILSIILKYFKANFRIMLKK